MKQFLLATLLATPFVANAQNLPQSSPPGHVEQIVGLTTIKVDYARPSKRDRVIFGDLVPFGKVWRTGANKCTTVSFDGPVTIDGEVLAPGIYSLFTIPDQSSWTVIFNKDTALWGEEDRKDSLDVLRIKVQPSKAYEPAETFTIGFADVRDDKAYLQLRWENVLVSMKVYADATKQGIANIKEAVADPKAGYGVFNRSARFCVDRNIMLDSALEWAEKSVSLERKYWNLYTLALARAANGKTKEAIAAAEESMKLAQAEKNDAYVKMNKERIEEWSKPKPVRR